MNELDYALGEMDRRMGNMLRFGTVAEVDPAGALAKVDLGDLVTDWLPWGTPHAGQDRVWWTPDVGEQVAIVTPGDPSMGFIIASLFSNANPANGNAAKDRRITFKDGTVVEFDREGSVLQVIVKDTGNIKVKVGATQLTMQDGQATLKATAITLDGNVTVTGTTTMQGDATMQANATVQGSTSVQAITSRSKNISNTHTHSGVQPGAANTGGVN